MGKKAKFVYMKNRAKPNSNSLKRVSNQKNNMQTTWTGNIFPTSLEKTIGNNFNF